jgi:hypothetical protein
MYHAWKRDSNKVLARKYDERRSSERLVGIGGRMNLEKKKTGRKGELNLSPAG